jgi:hypothetical protein
MDQAVSHQPPNTEARENPYTISGEQSVSATRYPQSSSVFHCQYHSTVALHTHVPPGKRTVGPLVAAIQRHGLTPLT